MKNLLLHAINHTPSRYVVMPERASKILREGKCCNLMFDDGYQSIYDALIRTNPGACHRILLFLVAGKIGDTNDWDSSGELAGKPLLSWKQIDELKKLGVRFGSHSLTHADLTKLGDRELERETKESKRILEDRLGEGVEGFSYPFGYFNKRVLSAVEDAGYKWAVTTSDSIWEGRGNPYRMRRINISGLDSNFLIWSKITGLYDIKALWELPALALEKMALLLKR